MTRSSEFCNEVRAIVDAEWEYNHDTGSSSLHVVECMYTECGYRPEMSDDGRCVPNDGIPF